MADTMARAMAHAAKMGQVSVIDFGAKGKHTDDTVAIQSAIDFIAANGGGDVIVPSGDYDVSSTIEVKPRVHLKCSHGTTIRPTANVNVINLRKNGQISGAKIDTYDYVAFSKSCIFVDGSDKFDFTHNTSIRSMILYGRGPRIREYPPTPDGSPTVDHESTGILLYAKGHGNNVVAVHVYDVNIMYLGKGVHLYTENTGGGTMQWVNGNQFDMIGFSGNQYDIYMTGSVSTLQEGVYSTSGNIFTNIQVQPETDITRTCFHINGRFNRIIAKVWDTHVVKSGILARLADKTDLNIISSNLEKKDVEDLGKNNKIDAIYEPNDSFKGTMISGIIPPQVVENPSFAGNQDDCLAYADKKFTITQCGPAPISGKLSNAFSINPSDTVYWDATNITPEAPLVIEIAFPSTLTYFEGFGVSFGKWDESPKNVKLERLYQGNWVEVYNYIDLTARVHIIHQKPMPYTDAFRLTMSGWNATSKRIRITRIFGQSSSLIGQSGGAFLPTIGGKLYGNLDMGNGYLTVGNAASFTSLPSPSDEHRGKMITVRGVAGAQDNVYMCVKTSGDTYVWMKINLTSI